MSEIIRISPEEAREKVSDGKALLVCAYDSDEKFAKFHLEGAISLADFKGMADELQKDQQIILYCN